MKTVEQLFMELKGENMKNYEWIKYTYRHRRAFEYCVKKLVKEPELRQEMLRRAEVHDMDKMIRYLLMSQEDAQKLHVQTKAHHLENDLPKSYEDLVETVIDYECAPYTKPDKPLNAYDFTKLLVEYKVLDENTAGKLFGIMNEFGIDCSADLTNDKEGMEYVNSCGDITEEMLYEEILCYIDKNPCNELKEILAEVHLRHKDPRFRVM